MGILELADWIDFDGRSSENDVRKLGLQEYITLDRRERRERVMVDEWGGSCVIYLFIFYFMGRISERGGREVAGLVKVIWRI